MSATVDNPKPSASSSGTRRVASSASAATPLSKPPCQIHPKAVISERAVLVGTHPITIGANSVLHPFSRIDSTAAAVTIGEYCIISERSVVGVSEANKQKCPHGILLEDSVTIETGAIVEAARIGKGTIIGISSTVEAGVSLGEYSKLSPYTIVKSSAETIPDFTVMSDGEQRIDFTAKSRPDIRELRLKGQAMRVDTLRRLIPSNTANWMS